MVRVAPVPVVGAFALLLLGCAGGTNRLSYGEVQSLNPGVTAAWCIEEFPCGKVTRGEDGKVRTIRYGVVDPAGRSQSLLLGFDACEILCTKRYSGPVIRPPKPKKQDPPPCAPVSPCGPPLPSAPRGP